MVCIQKRLEQKQLQIKMTMQLHDELNLTVPKTDLLTVRKVVVKEMEQAIKLRVPLVADCGVGSIFKRIEKSLKVSCLKISVNFSGVN